MAEAAKKIVRVPRCPECDGNAWDINPDSIGVELGENDDGEWYLDISWLDGFSATCQKCEEPVETGSELEWEIARFACVM